MTSSTESPSTRLSFVDSAAIAVTFFSLGVTLQVLLIDRGSSVWRAFVASALIFSATSQFAYLAVRDAGGTEWAGIAAGTIVATRFGILAMTLIPRLPVGGVRRTAAALNSFDPNVAVGVQQSSPPAVEREFWRTTAAMMLGWFAGIAIGTFLGDVLGDVDRFGLDAVFPAALLAIIANLLRTSDGMMAAVAGALICLLLLPVAPAGVPIIASVGGVVIAIAVSRRRAAS